MFLVPKHRYIKDQREQLLLLFLIGHYLGWLWLSWSHWKQWARCNRALFFNTGCWGFCHCSQYQPCACSWWKVLLPWHSRIHFWWVFSFYLKVIFVFHFSQCKPFLGLLLALFLVFLTLPFCFHLHVLLMIKFWFEEQVSTENVCDLGIGCLFLKIVDSSFLEIT